MQRQPRTFSWTRMLTIGPTCICLDLSFGAKHGPGEDHQVYVRFYTLIPKEQALQSQEAVSHVPGISASYK